MLSSDKRYFLDTKHAYELLLSNTVVLLKSCNSRSTQHPEKKTWFNPSFSSNVETKIGKKFFNILDKYFPNHHNLHKVINRNTVKLSYCCMPNVGRLLKAHNQKVLKQRGGDSTGQDSATCICILQKSPTSINSRTELVSNAALKKILDNTVLLRVVHIFKNVSIISK